MKKYVKKVYLSIMLVVFSLLTMVATTYAWVGLLTSSTFDEFTINLQQSDNPDASEYGIELSLDGINFSESIDQTELRRRLLYNIDSTDKFKDILTKNSSGNYVVSNNKVNEEFRKNKLEPCTTYVEGTGQTKQLAQFFNMKGLVTKKYYFFDLYLSIFKIGGGETQSDMTMNLYLRDSILSSATVANPSGIYETTLFNDIIYPNTNLSYRDNNILNNSLPGSVDLGAKFSGKYSVDISTSCRLAIEKLVAVDKYHPEQYYGMNSHRGLYIFQKGSIYPVYNSLTNVVDFGGILPSEYNFARMYYNSLHPGEELGEVPANVLNRGDVIFADDGITNKIVDKDTDNVTTSNMIRFRIYFWYEGWDSNCFDVIDDKSVTLNLSFSTKNPND